MSFIQSLLLQNIKALPADKASKHDATIPKTKSASGSQSSLLDIHDDADDDSCLPLSSDGKFLILSPTSDESSEDVGGSASSLSTATGVGREEEESNA